MSVTFFPQDIIIKKRYGGTLTKEEIDFFAHGVADGRFADYQATALLMAIFWRSLTPQETFWLTDAMLHSGEIIDLRDLPGAKVDKHSTGGVGDKVSLTSSRLLPLPAASKVPMMSGRGLGHTGGTLDKLEAIPGFRVMLSVPEFRTILQQVGTAVIGQTPQIVPADRKLYSLRDVTGTVECIPLICASIAEQKTRRGYRLPGARYQVWPRCVHENQGAGDGTGQGDGCHRQSRRQTGPRLAYRNESTARSCCGPYDRSHRIHRMSEGPRTLPI